MNIIQKFTDKDGTEFELWDSVWQHIQDIHHEMNTFETLTNVLQQPDFIVQSSWEKTSVLYYRKEGRYYKTVVVALNEKRIKTAFTTHKIKQGEVIWKKNG